MSSGAERVTQPQGLRSNRLHSSPAELVGAFPCCCWTRTQLGLSRVLSSGGKSHITGAGGEGSALLDPQGWRP